MAQVGEHADDRGEHGGDPRPCAPLRDGGPHLNYFVYHDRYQRTPDGWKLIELIAEFKYVDITPLAGSARHAAGDTR